MSFSYPTVTIAGNDYSVYGDTDAADLYLSAALQAVQWQALSASAIDTKGTALVTAVRMLDRQRWLGDQADPTNALQWPRINTGIVSIDGIVPPKIIEASFELAEMLLEGSDTQNEQNSAQKIHSLSAGGVNITYFRAAEGLTFLRFPVIVQELVREYLASAVLIDAASSKGTHKKSITRENFGFNRGL